MSSKVIAIDGPCYVGKSTVARELSILMSYRHINTGHMYRAVAKEALLQRIPLEDKEGIIKIANYLDIHFELRDSITRTIIDGQDLTDSLDLPEIVSSTPKIALIPELRKILTKKQRSYLDKDFVILEVETLVLWYSPMQFGNSLSQLHLKLEQKEWKNY